MDHSLAPGSSFGGFRIEGTLGQGGMGTVYRALGPAGEAVALKVLTGEGVSEKVFRARFRREAEIAEKIVHPGIVRCLGSGEHGGLLWIALELMPGGSLEDRIAKTGPLPWREAAALAAEIARALAAIHETGAVHRDLKPANVLLDAQGRPRVTDFGIAHARTVAGQSLTRTGQFIGTPQYMAPEQVDEAKRVDGRADLYALGCMIHALVAGSPPFTGGSALELAGAHLGKEPPALRSRAPVPPSLDVLTAQLLASGIL